MIFLHLISVSLLALSFHRSIILWTKLTLARPRRSPLSEPEPGYTAGSPTPNPAPALAEATLWRLTWNVGKQPSQKHRQFKSARNCRGHRVPSQTTSAECAPVTQPCSQLPGAAACSTAPGCCRRPQGMETDVQKRWTPHHIQDMAAVRQAVAMYIYWICCHAGV